MNMNILSVLANSKGTVSGKFIAAYGCASDAVTCFGVFVDASALYAVAAVIISTDLTFCAEDGKFRYDIAEKCGAKLQSVGSQ